MPEVAINGWPLDYPHSGSAVYTRSIASLLPFCAPDLQFRLYVRNAHLDERELRLARLRDPISSLDGAFSARLGKLAWETLSVPMAAAAHAVDLLHYPYFAAPLVKPVATVVTIHDVIPLALEGYHRSGASRYYTSLMSRAVRNAAAVVTVSEHARSEILCRLRIDPGKLFVTPEAADDRFCPEPSEDDGQRLEKYRLPPRFFLYLGGVEKRKNIETLVRAWKEALPTLLREDLKLLLVADFPRPDALYPDIPRLIRELELEQTVSLIKSVDEDDKPALYRAAVAFCFPSRYEGFGLPPLEALASGLPALVSSSTSLPEVVGDAALLFAPDDVGAWSEALKQVAASADLRADLKAKGRKQAARFSWKETALKTADVYRRVLAA